MATVSEAVKVAVIDDGWTGPVHPPAPRAATAADKRGTRGRPVTLAGLARAEAIASNEAGAAHAAATADVPVATSEDLAWADVALVATPTRYGDLAARRTAAPRHPGWPLGPGRARRAGPPGLRPTGITRAGRDGTLLVVDRCVDQVGASTVPPGRPSHPPAQSLGGLRRAAA